MAHSLIQGKRFFCREWVFSKILHFLENLQHREEGGGGNLGILIVSGPGGGKTAICSELVTPTVSHGKQVSLRKRLLAYHFCQSHDLNTLSVTEFILCVVQQLKTSSVIVGYGDKIQNENLNRVLIGEDPDAAFKRLIAFPLLELESPKHTSFLLVDSIDESCITANFSSTTSSYSSKKLAGSKTVGELLGNNSHLLPPWLILICTARKQSKPVAKLFSGFRKISLDDLRKSQVIRDVQQYILSRLDQDYSLRQHIRRETAEMLNQLHIKSNGCFLYLEKVLDGISENFIVLREIREIPGTLFGLYLWLCQRLFTKKQFSKVQPILCVLLSSRKPMHEDEIFACLRQRYNAVTKEDFCKRMHVLRRVLIVSSDAHHILFHNSFAEWFLDVKYCTQKYLCQAAEGHIMKGLELASRAADLTADEVTDLAYHIVNSSKYFSDANMMAVFLLSLGLKKCGAGIKLHDYDPNVHKLLSSCALLENSSETNDLSSTEKGEEINNRESETCLDEGGGEAPCENSEETTMLNGPSEEQVDGTCTVNEVALHIDLNQVDYNQRTPLHIASNDGDIKLVELFISRGAHLESTDRHGRTPLNLAARQGHEAVIRTLIEANADVNHADNDGWTPLRSAAWAGHVEVVDILLQKFAEVDLTDGDGRTALRAAAWGGHEEVVISLLKAGASPSLPDNEGRTPLIAAAYMGHADIVDKLLNAGANVNHADSDGRTALSVAALCVAASQGHLKVVNLLLERNAEVDHQDRDGTTPLLVAAFEGHKEVCELLLEYEADVDAVDKAGRTPLWAAASMGHASVCELLLFWGAYVDHIDGEGRTVLSVAAAQGNVSVVRLLLARGLDEGHRDNAGWTPLHYASFEGHQEVTEGLVEAGAKINEVDNDGKHALLLSSQEGHVPVVESLLNLGADINQRSHDGRTALRAAAIEGYRDVVQILVHRGAEINYRDADGRNTLYLLALENRASMAQFLIRCGADVEARDLEGRTPLHVSAWQGHLEMVELLVSAGAEVNAVDNDRRTPLQSASWQGHSEIVRLLCDRGSKIDHTCNQGATALCIAAQEGHLECVRILLDWGANPTHSDRCGRTPIRVALKSGHSSISKLLGDIVLAKNKTLLAKEKSMEWERMGAPFEPGKPSNTSQNSLYRSTGEPSTGNLQSPPAAQVSSMDMDKRKSFSSAGATGGGQSSTKSSYNSEHGGPPTVFSNQELKLDKANYDESKSYGLSFTQQVQQMSRLKGRPGSRLLSPLKEPSSPIYASPPQSPSSDSVNEDGISPNLAFPTASHSQSGIVKADWARGNVSGSPILNNGCGLQSFAFNRDSHMKIILGGGSESCGISRNSRKNGVVNSSNSGIISATSAIKSGFTALKAGVMEAAGSRKSQQNDSPLVSAASMAVPNLLRKKPSKSDGNGILQWKRETPL